jgi:hypothetical protein
MNMYRRARESKMSNFALADESKTVLYEELPVFECVPAIREEVTGFRFWGGTVIWLDIVSSITMGTAPYLLSFHTDTITPGSQTKLENIIGCEGWVMLQIGRIAAIHQSITLNLQQGHIDCSKTEHSVAAVRRELERNLTQVMFNSKDISKRYSNPTALVTHVFVQMATVYLHLIIHGFQQLDLLDRTISDVMQVLQTQHSTPLPALVLPLFVFGAVAGQRDENWFRNAFSTLPLISPGLKHRTNIMPILEEIWDRRRVEPALVWRDVLPLTHDILLV